MKKDRVILPLLFVLMVAVSASELAAGTAGEESPQQAATSSATEITSTCWVTCFSFSPPGKTSYTIPNVTEYDCCNGLAWSCPPGATPSHPFWGEPAESCSVSDW